MSPHSSENKRVLTLGGAIALGALIAYKLPNPDSKSSGTNFDRRPKHRPEPRRPSSPPPPWRKYPPLHHPHYRQERYYLHYKDPEGHLCVVDQRPVDGTVTGSERRAHGGQERGFEVERYYRVDGTEAGPNEAHRIVKRGYPKWDR